MSAGLGKLNGTAYLLGDFLLRPDKRLVDPSGQAVPLAPRPYQVLLYLIEHRDRVVTRHELLEQFWDGKDVYDDTLRKCVGTIRKALKDSSGTPRFIETHYAEGYRYIGPLDRPDTPATEVERTVGVQVTIEEEVMGPGEAQPARARHKRAALAVAVLAFCAAALTFYWRSSSGGLPPPAGSLAVLPLRNLTGDAGKEYLCDGLTEGLITALSRIESLKVISRGSVYALSGKGVDPRTAGRRLGVASVLEGSVRQDGDSVRVEVRLVSTDNGRVLWASDTYDRRAVDLFAIQDEIARGVTMGLRLNLSPGGERRLAKRYTTSLVAYQDYLKGRYFWKNQKNHEGLKKAFDSLHAAVAKDPQFALAYAGLADCHITSIWFLDLPPRPALAQARAAARRALELDESLPEALIALGRVQLNDWDLAGAARLLERAIALDPGSGYARHQYAYPLVLAGRFDEAVAAIRRARELDPLAVSTNVDVGEILLYAGRYDEAVKELKHALGLDPNRANAHQDLALAYEQQGLHGEAVEEFLKMAALRGERPDTIAALRAAYEAAGMSGYWRKRLELAREEARRGHVPIYNLALMYARLGKTDQAFELLEQAYQDRSAHLINLKVQPELTGLRDDPRYADLLRRVGLGS